MKKTFTDREKHIIRRLKKDFRKGLIRNGSWGKNLTDAERQHEIGFALYSERLGGRLLSQTLISILESGVVDRDAAFDVLNRYGMDRSDMGCIS